MNSYWVSQTSSPLPHQLDARSRSDGGGGVRGSGVGKRKAPSAEHQVRVHKTLTTSGGEASEFWGWADPKISAF